MSAYWPAIAISVSAHGVVVLLLVLGWAAPPEVPAFKPPPVIQVTLVDVKVQSKPSSTQRAVPSEPPRIDAAKRRKELQRQKQQRKKQQQRKQQEKRRIEQKRRAQEKAEKEKQARQTALNKQKQAQREKQRLAKALAAEQQAREDQQLTQFYSSWIRQQVESHWSRPPSARNGMQARLAIQLVPTGEVIDVKVVESSGNDAFDHSTMRAVKRVRQFTKVKDMPSRVFEQSFRQLDLLFHPQDLPQ